MFVAKKIAVAIGRGTSESNCEGSKEWCCMGRGTPHRGGNIGDLLDKVSRSCLLHPTGRKLSRGRSAEVLSLSEDEEESSDLASPENGRSPNRSVQLQPMESADYEKLLQRMQAMEELFTDIFETTYTLKTAYIRLQMAHSPYDPEKLHHADKAVVSQLQKLSDLKQSYRRVNGFICTVPPGKFADMEDQKKIVATYESVVTELKTEVREKDAEIQFLKQNLKQVTKNIEKLERRLKKYGIKDDNRETQVQRRISMESPTPELFQSTFEQVHEATNNFTKVLMAEMKKARWDVNAAAAAIAPAVSFRKPNHIKFAFNSYLCEKLFQGFENESFYISGSLSSLLEPEKHRQDCFTQFRDMLPMEPSELLNILPDCAFGKFCNKKYLGIVHPKMEEAFFGNFDHRSDVVNGKHPNSDFYQTFIRLAKAVWILHKLAFSFNPVPSHFHVKANSVFQSTYMESVLPLHDSAQGGVQLVAFAITPGFKFVPDTVIKSRVYVVHKLGNNPAE
ncbi:protein GRAVITROPIC IN THE LIGHT 1 isoform X2 [Cryptomeria japonica]|uniref:protein GRAVITROPIC IN THE LIGHT 1 isoform X2 n=1 Tax=Cryptomeria japonica TaxID=3369 RepID=UPI0025ACA37B|nr:protein GRAVITROPIC IN THE LIGHT 1 isoform X2 [Cryptomeria japonica]